MTEIEIFKQLGEVCKHVILEGGKHANWESVIKTFKKLATFAEEINPKLAEDICDISEYIEQFKEDERKYLRFSLEIYDLYKSYLHNIASAR